MEDEVVGAACRIHYKGMGAILGMPLPADGVDWMGYSLVNERQRSDVALGIRTENNFDGLHLNDLEDNQPAIARWLRLPDFYFPGGPGPR